MVPTSVKRLWLRRLYSQTTAGGGSTYATLQAALNAYAFPAGDSLKGGTIASTQANNHSVAFSNRDNGATPEDTAAAWSELLDLYDLCNAALIASGIATPSDAERFTEMKDRLQPVREFQMAYTHALCG